MVKLDKQYTFDGPAGRVRLADLFAGRRQLIVYHFMFDPDWERGCSGCTGLVDSMGNLQMLAERDTTLVFISRAPLDKLETYKKVRGWNLPWYSSFGTDFNYDFHVTNDESIAPVQYNYKGKDELLNSKDPGAQKVVKGEGPGMSVFFREGDKIFHTYSTFARGLDTLLVTNRLLDITPLGRQGEIVWQYHDEYDVGKKEVSEVAEASG